LSRLLKCQDEWEAYLCAFPEQEDDDSARAKICQKHEVPSGIFLMGAECNTEKALKVTRWVKPFVAGQLTSNLIETAIIGEAMEMDEYDFGWVWLGVETNFYGKEDGADEEDVTKEMLEIGTRAQKKSLKCKQWEEWNQKACECAATIEWERCGYKRTWAMIEEDVADGRNGFDREAREAVRKEKHPLPVHWRKRVEEAWAWMQTNQEP